MVGRPNEHSRSPRPPAGGDEDTTNATRAGVRALPCPNGLLGDRLAYDNEV